MADFADLPEAMQDAMAALDAEMAAHGKGREAPVREVMAMMGDRWTSLIVLVLASGEWRHADLRRTLGELSAEQAISQRVLTAKLRALERDGFVDRSVSDDVPPRVSYRLTELGDELHGEIRRTIDWVNQRGEAIRTSRSRFDAKE